MVNYQNFIEKINYETEKLGFLKKLFTVIYETLEFMDNYNMYSLFLRFDTRNDKMFDANQLSEFLASLGLNH